MDGGCCAKGLSEWWRRIAGAEGAHLRLREEKNFAQMP